MHKKSIVITGCSSGFGRVTALDLAKRGWHVFATVRKEEDRTSLLEEAETQGFQHNLTSLLCDITQAEQVATLKQQVEELLHDEATDAETAKPHLDALLNNAGTAFGGPIELLPLADLRAQLEINVIAHVGVIQAFLPLLKAGKGTIINVSSVGGRISMPVMGAYSISKFALEAMSDALRIEIAPFGVHVAIIEPTSSPTTIWETSMHRAQSYLDGQREGPYQHLLTITEKVAKRSASIGFPPQLFAKKVHEILESDQPRPRYPLPFSASFFLFMRHMLPDGVWDRLVRRTLKW